MSAYTPGDELSRIASADLSAQRYRLVELDANDQIALSGAASADTLGVLQDTPRAGDEGAIKHSGITKVVYGGAIAINDPITADANAAAVAAQAGNPVHGRALKAGVAGDIGLIRLERQPNA